MIVIVLEVSHQQVKVVIQILVQKIENVDEFIILVVNEHQLITNILIIGLGLGLVNENIEVLLFLVLKLELIVEIE